MIGPACDRVPLPEADREAITAWRCWFVLPEECRLRPIYRRGLVWKPREALEAVCPDQVHEVPDDRCKCGVWAVSAPEDLHEVTWTSVPPKGIEPLPGVLVVGQISMWGRLIEYEFGWRSSHAYPKHLYAFTDDPALAAALRDTYLVPVEYGDKAQALADLLPSVEEPAPAVAGPPARPSAPPSPPDHKAPFLAVVEPITDSALKGLAATLIDKRAGFNGWFYNACAKDRDCVGTRRRQLGGAKATLEGAIIRGTYYANFYGDAWKEHLRREIKAQAVDLVETFAAHRALAGDHTAARRFVWLQIAGPSSGADEEQPESPHGKETEPVDGGATHQRVQQALRRTEAPPARLSRDPDADLPRVVRAGREVRRRAG
jgi:hypothetical protein